MDGSVSVADLICKWENDLALLTTCIQSGDEAQAGALAAELARCQVRISSKEKNMFPLGTDVMYFSTSLNEWIPAVVEGTDERKQIYCLDCHPEAPVDRVRLPAQQQQCVVPPNVHKPPHHHNASTIQPLSHHGWPPHFGVRPIQPPYHFAPTMTSAVPAPAASVHLSNGAPPPQASVNHNHIGAPMLPNATPCFQTRAPFFKAPVFRAAPLQSIPNKAAPSQSKSYLPKATPAHSSSCLPQAMLACCPHVIAPQVVTQHQQQQGQQPIVPMGRAPNHKQEYDKGQQAVVPMSCAPDNRQGGRQPFAPVSSPTDLQQGVQPSGVRLSGPPDVQQNVRPPIVPMSRPPNLQQGAQPLIVAMSGPPVVQQDAQPPVVPLSGASVVQQDAQPPVVPLSGPSVVQQDAQPPVVPPSGPSVVQQDAQQTAVPMNGPPESVADLCALSADDFALPFSSGNPFAPNLLNPFVQDSLNIHARVHLLAPTSTTDDQMSEDEKFARQLQQDLNFPSESSSSSSNYMRQCLICKTQISIVDAFTLDCEHTCCPGCLRDHLVNDGRAVETVGCPCGHPLTPTQLQAVLGDELEEIYAARLDSALRQIELEEEEHLPAPRQYRCPLCFDEVVLDEMVSLECDHRLCTECFGNYLKTKVTDGQVAGDEMVCPLPNCKLELSLIMIEAHLTPAMWDKFLSFRMKIFRPHSGDLVQCPKASCSSFIAPSGLKKVTCPVCCMEFCPSCNEEPHMEVSCEEFRKWKLENNTGDKTFEQLIEDEQWKRCPKCGFACERSEGCNFMQCVSATCRRKTYFCYICGDELTKDLHYAHFPKGPHIMKCDNMPNGPAPKLPAKAPARPDQPQDPWPDQPQDPQSIDYIDNPFRDGFGRPRELFQQVHNWFARHGPEHAQ